MKEIYSSNNEFDLQFVKGLLEENSIRVNIKTDGVGGYLRTIGGDYNLMKILQVNEEDYELAKELLLQNNITKQPTSKQPKYIRIAALIGLGILLAGLIYSIIDSFI